MSNRKAAGENGELSRQLEEVDQHVSQLHKLRHQLNSQLEDVKKTYEEEAKERQSLLGAQYVFFKGLYGELYKI